MVFNTEHDVTRLVDALDKIKLSTSLLPCIILNANQRTKWGRNARGYTHYTAKLHNVSQLLSVSYKIQTRTAKV